MIHNVTAKRIVLCFMILFLIGFPLTSHASYEVTLYWSTSDQDLEGYQVFGREEGQDYDYETPWWQGDGSFNQCAIDELDERKTYFFVVRAFAGDDMSADSNEVRYAYGDNRGSFSDGQSGSGCFFDLLIQDKES
jgi:hypothetical protein